jgi:hypothetical protein
MFNPTLNNTDNKSRSTARLMAIGKPLALMAVLLSVSPAAFAARDCNEKEMAVASDFCNKGGLSVGSCSYHAGKISGDCCTSSGESCVGYSLGTDGDILPEDDYRGDPVDPPPSPHDADDLFDEEPGFSDDDGGIRGADDGDTGRDDDDDGDTGDGDTGRDDDDDGDTGDADTGDADTGDDGFDTGDADDTSADDEDASADDDDTSADDEDASVDDDDTQADGDVDTEPEVSDTSAGCSTVGQAGGGLMALILGALLGLTRRQVRWS